MRIFLAPMDGLTDDIMRHLLTRVGGIDVCVTEFVRITNTLLPKKVFYRASPELLNSGKTVSGVPVRLQLLGSDPVCLAENAALAASLGAPAIDLNFGCPAKTVNRSNGGAVLLREPENLYKIVKSVKSALNGSTPLTAKMRLGYDDKSLALECASAIEDAGADELIIHARTKTEGYRPPAYWDWIAKIREVVSLPVVANGEIWSVQDYLRCKEQSACNDVMIGRGLISNPNLAKQCKLVSDGEPFNPIAWPDVVALLIEFFELTLAKMGEKHATGRIKQWLRYLSREFTEAEALFLTIRQDKTPQLIIDKLKVCQAKVLNA